MGNSKHALGEQRYRGGAGTNRIPRHNSSNRTAPGPASLGGVSLCTI